MVLALLAGAGTVVAGDAPGAYRVNVHSSEKRIRAAILARIPLGATRDEVRKFIEERLWHTGQIYDWPIPAGSHFTESDREKLRALGLPAEPSPIDRATSEIPVQVGAYFWFLTYTRVFVSWYFDADGRVVEVGAVKESDTPQ